MAYQFHYPNHLFTYSLLCHRLLTNFPLQFPHVWYSLISPPFLITFLFIVGIVIVLYLAAGSYALIVGSIFSDKQVAMTLIPVVVTPLMLFAGYFANSNNIPIYLKEFEYISFFKYGL